MSKQESVSDWMELAKAYDKAEREQDVQPYVKVNLCNKRTNEVLYRYDLPRESFWRWHWVIDWRAARLLCKNPKDGISHVLDFYDKTTGLEYGFGSLISSLTSAKANTTRIENELKQYIETRQNDMFFNPEDDVIVGKLKSKISAYKAKAAEMEQQIKSKVIEIKTGADK